jgi:SAM-dependent methyltransferase
MQTPPKLTDRQALLRNRTRALQSAAPALFLHDEAVSEVQDRLSMVNRTFTDVAVITGFPALWAAAFPGATIVADADTLALSPGSFDLVIHAMALHWAGDPVGQLVQARRALRPDGLFMAVCFGGQTLHELRSCLAEAESRTSGSLSLRVLPMGEVRDLGGLLQRAGFALPVADSAPRHVTYESAYHLMRDLRAMGENNALAQRNRRPARRQLFATAAEIYADNYPAESGRIQATFEMLVLTGWAPDDSQQKPLRPGSARARLADALSAEEFKLPDRAG